MTFSRLASLLLALAAVASFTSCASSHSSTWASAASQPGLPSPIKNFHWVSPTLARGAQPSAADLAELDRMGFKTIVNLRGFHSDPSTRTDNEHIKFNTWHAEDEDVVAFLKIANDPSKTPVFVHCLHGSDRTGTMVAMYRMAVQGWSRETAIQEMINGGFGFHPQWINLVHYLRKVDVKKIKEKAGIS